VVEEDLYLSEHDVQVESVFIRRNITVEASILGNI